VNDAAKIVEMVRKAKKNVWIVLNKKRNKDYELGTKEIEAMLGVKIISVINDDNKVPESISKGIPVVLYSAGSKSAISFKKLAAHILGEDYEPNIADRVKWFMGF
jgi:MinD-like ATPase involved in chromosome partitioning or flagellar assembly